MKKDNILVSVILSVYNAEKYLAQAIESILNQTYSNFEFIIINDGSTDHSLELIKKYMKQDKRIILITRENKGLVYSLNEGISLSKGKYIIRMDADDISLEDRFKKQVEFMENNSQIGICGCFIEIFGKNKTTNIWKLPIQHEALKIKLLFGVPFAHPSVIIRKDILNKYHLKYEEEYKTAEDYKLWSKLVDYTQFSNINEVLLKYRYIETSISRTADKDKSDKRYIVLKNIFTKILYKLNIKNTEDENRLHFILGLNERIIKEDIDLNFLNQYLNKIIDANKSVKYFDQSLLEYFLSKKFVVVAYYQFKKRNYQVINLITSKLLYKYCFYIIKRDSY